ncbi:MAG: hypothetical protein AB7G06_05310 [Bdellovibrionales bacterium]
MKKLYLFLFFICAGPTYAGVNTVSSPSITRGELTAEVGFGWENDDVSADFYEHRLEIGYAPVGYLKLEVEGTAQRVGADELDYTSTTLKGTLMLLEQGELSPVAAALRVEYKHAHAGGGADAIDPRILLQRKEGRAALVLNLGISKSVGDNSTSGVSGDLRASARYQLADRVRGAIEYLGDTGTLHNMRGFAAQDHRLGPVAKIDLTEHAALEIGYLAGISADAPNHSVKMNMGFAF